MAPLRHVLVPCDDRKINTQRKTVKLLASTQLRPLNCFSHAHLLGSFFCGQEVESCFCDSGAKVFHGACLQSLTKKLKTLPNKQQGIIKQAHIFFMPDNVCIQVVSV